MTSLYKRIASLHEELAEAYRLLAEEQQPKKRKRDDSKISQQITNSLKRSGIISK